MTFSKLPNPYQIIVKQMFKIAGHEQDLDKIDFKNSRWYDEYTWTKDQQEKFRSWLIQELKSNKELLRSLSGKSLSFSRRYINRLVDEFILFYGFRVKDIQKENKYEKTKPNL